MSMPHPPTAHRHPHSNARQFDLFCAPPYAAAQTPQWRALPAETRHTLTKLMVRLIFGHADEASGGLAVLAAGQNQGGAATRSPDLTRVRGFASENADFEIF